MIYRKRDLFYLTKSNLTNLIILLDDKTNVLLSNSFNKTSSIQKLNESSPSHYLNKTTTCIGLFSGKHIELDLSPVVVGFLLLNSIRQFYKIKELKSLSQQRGP